MRLETINIILEPTGLVAWHDVLARHPLSIIPNMDDAHIPNLETLSYGGAFALAQMHSDALVISLVASDTLRNSHDAEKSTSSTSYVKLKEMKLNAGLPACRLKFDLRQNVADTGGARGRIYKNGAAIGTERSTASTTYVTFSEDFTYFVLNDLIQIYALHDYGRTSYVRNERVYYDTVSFDSTPPTNQDP